MDMSKSLDVIKCKNDFNNYTNLADLLKHWFNSQGRLIL